MRLRLLLASLLAGLTLPAVPALASPVDPKIEEGLGSGEVRVIVELSDPSATAEVAAASPADVILQQAVAQPYLVVEADGSELAELAADPRVTRIRRDRAFPPSALSTLPVIGADKAHAAGFTGQGQAIAVLDTGIDRDHPAFTGRIAGEACFSATDGGAESLCPNGQASMIGEGAADVETAACAGGICDHGSHVAGIAAAVAPGASIVPVQVFSRHSSPDVCGDQPPCVMAYESSLLQALDYVNGLQLGVAAVNLSLGGELFNGPCDDEVFKPKIDALLARGTATVVAAGNETFDGVSFPGCVSSAVTVGATDNSSELASFSNRGPLVDLLAPGVEVESAVPDDLTAVHSGTSMATPHVAGALAVLKARSPSADTNSLVESLKQYGLPVTYTLEGGGSHTTPRLDVNAAITGVAPTPAPSGPSPEPQPQPDPDPDPEPEPEPSDTDDPTPVPLPTITVTVTVTVTPSPVIAAPVCARGTSTTRLTSSQWANEIHRARGTMSDATLTCYLRLVQKSSKVFPELTKASTLGTAYRVLKAGKTAKQRTDRALLTGWLNWANGQGSTGALTSTEKARLKAN
ncbi:MAG: S8 family serine peptidase [Thermoactinospora sp.]|nr:S8 family serine peptidase [Thermoactinospora sp.]